MKKGRLAPLLWVILLPVFLSGCWDMREINDLGFVTAVGIDKAVPPNRYAVTVQIANANSASAKSQQGQTESGVWVGTGEGKSLFDAVRNLVRIASRRVMWAHNNVIIISESQAREGILPIADFFTHNPELRLKTPVVVARGDAKDFILAKAGMETPSGLSFVYFYDYNTLLGESVRSNMLTVSAALAAKEAEMLIAAVGLRKAADPPESGGGGGSGEKGSEPKTIDISGAAIFRGDKLAGWLSPQETRGIAWIMGATNNTIVTVSVPSRHNRSLAVETRNVKAKMIAKVVTGLPRVTVRINGVGSIVEEDGGTGQDLDRVKKELGKRVSRQIADEIRAGLQKIQQEYRSDVIGMGARVHIQNNREWESGLKTRWRTVFPKVPVTVAVDIRIRGNTLKQLPERSNH